MNPGQDHGSLNSVVNHHHFWSREYATFHFRFPCSTSSLVDSSLPSRWHWEAHSDGLPMIIKWKWQYSFPFRSPRKENLIRGGIAEIPNWLWMTDPKLLICELFRVGWDGSHGLRNYVPWGLAGRLSVEELEQRQNRKWCNFGGMSSTGNSFW